MFNVAVGGVPYPNGAVATMFVFPVVVPLARKLNGTLATPPVKVTDAAETVPTFVALLLMGTATVKGGFGGAGGTVTPKAGLTRPARTCWFSTQFPDASRRQDNTLIPV